MREIDRQLLSTLRQLEPIFILYDSNPRFTTIVQDRLNVSGKELGDFTIAELCDLIELATEEFNS